MPEGHTIHRAAIDHHKVLAGDKLTVQSPQGRFAEGSRYLTGKLCTAVEAFGKHLMMVYCSAMNGMAFRHFDLRVISNNS